MKNIEWCIYTYKHRLAFLYTVNKLIKDDAIKKELLKRAKIHDMDKMLLYQFLDQNESQNYHIMHQPHHLESGLGSSRIDLYETVIDYESAPLTKPDKPLNAYDFTHKLLRLEFIDEKTAGKLFEIMKALGIDNSNTISDNERENFLNNIGEINHNTILLEILDYVSHNPAPELEYIKNRIIP